MKYRYKIEVTVLTDNKINESRDDLALIWQECIEGADVGDWRVVSEEVLTMPQMAQALISLGSEPSFMGDDGWKYALHRGDEVTIDSGDNELPPSVIIGSINYSENGETAFITTMDGERIECLVDQIS